MDDKIVKLGFPEIIRLRPGMYVSSIENPTIIFREVVDNSIDEAFSYDKTSKISIITKGPDYIVADNGRGFPITLSEEHNVTSVELAVANLHAGSKFRKEPGKISVGTNGVGVSCTNALSEIFVVMAKVNQSNYSNSISAVKDSWTNNPNDHGNLFY
jgi:DNA gyrase subunit B